MSNDNVYDVLREQYRMQRVADVGEALLASIVQKDPAQCLEYLKTSPSERTADQLRDLCLERDYDADELVRFFKAVDKLAMAQYEKHL